MPTPIPPEKLLAEGKRVRVRGDTDITQDTSFAGMTGTVIRRVSAYMDDWKVELDGEAGAFCFFGFELEVLD